MTILVVKVCLAALLGSHEKVTMRLTKPTSGIILIVRTCKHLSGHGAHMPIRGATTMISHSTVGRKEAIAAFLRRGKEMLCAPVLPFRRVDRIIRTSIGTPRNDRHVPLHLGTVGTDIIIMMLTYIIDNALISEKRIATRGGRVQEVVSSFPYSRVLVIISASIELAGGSGDVPFRFQAVRTGLLCDA
jgi:hypothetical protein